MKPEPVVGVLPLLMMAVASAYCDPQTPVATPRLTMVHPYLAQWGGSGPGKGQLWGASGIAVSRSGYVYVADYVDDRIEVFDSSGAYVSQWGSKGTASLQFHHALGVAVDKIGRAHV